MQLLSSSHHDTKAGRKGAGSSVLKDEDLQNLGRLCGKSLLYLPAEYAPGSLVLPTCFRATGQYLIQHGKLHPWLKALSTVDEEWFCRG